VEEGFNVVERFIGILPDFVNEQVYMLRFIDSRKVQVIDGVDSGLKHIPCAFIFDFQLNRKAVIQHVIPPAS
jgi:hypothetical protein